MAFKNLRTIEKEMESQGLDVFDMSGEQESELRAIASGNTQSAFMAQSYLFLREREETPFSIGDWPEILAPYMDDNINILFKGDNKKESTDNIHIYPNPTDAQLTVDINIVEGTELELQIFDSQGKMIYQMKLNNATSHTLDTTKWPVGLYYYELTDNQQLIQKDKLLIVR